MTELHLEGLSADSQTKDLMAQADAEQRNLGIDGFLGYFNREVAGFRVSGTVGKEDTVRMKRHGFFKRCARRNNMNVDTSIGH